MSDRSASLWYCVPWDDCSDGSGLTALLRFGDFLSSSSLLNDVALNILAPVGNWLLCASNGFVIDEGVRSFGPEYRSVGGAILCGPYFFIEGDRRELVLMLRVDFWIRVTTPIVDD